jgi:hypothetical protein
MGIKQSLKKLIKGEPFDWHIPHTIGPDEALARCMHCSGVFVIPKSEQRSGYYCMSCR